MTTKDPPHLGEDHKKKTTKFPPPARGRHRLGVVSSLDS
jgi:hypothetical protein